MNNKLLLSIVAVLVLTLSGCAAVPPTAEELASADYGGLSTTKTYAVTTAERLIKGMLKDPDSVKFNWVSFGKGYVNSRSGTVYGWKLTGTANARNSFGGYTGGKPYIFLYRGGQLFAVWVPLTGRYGTSLHRIK